MKKLLTKGFPQSMQKRTLRFLNPIWGFVAILACWAFLSPSATCASTVYDVSSQFGTNSNPCGPWSYGWKTTVQGSFSNYVTLAHPNAGVDAWTSFSGSSTVFYNGGPGALMANGGQTDLPAGTVWFDPGANGAVDNYSAIRFTVPPGGAGNYSLSAFVAPAIVGFISGDCDFHVVTNGVEAFGVFLSPTQSAGYTNTLALSDGSTIDLMIGRGADGLQQGSELTVKEQIVATGLAATNPPPPPLTNGVMYDVAAQFGTNTNPSGPWSYGWKSTVQGSFSNYTILAHPNAGVDAWTSFSGSSTVFYNGGPGALIANGGQTDLPAGTVWFDPGANGAVDNYSAIRFTVPPGGAGNYSLSAFVAPAVVGSISGDCDFHVVTNGVEAFGVFLSPTQSAGYTNTLALSDGSTIDLMIGRGADGLQPGSELTVKEQIVATGLAATNPPPPPLTNGVLYDVSAQFGTNSNPGGPWSYGWKSTVQGSFSNYVTLAHPNAGVDAWTSFLGSSTVFYNGGPGALIANGGQTDLPAGTVWFDPGANGAVDNYSAIRFTVPPGGAGNYSLSAFVAPAIVGSISGDCDFHVVTNGIVAFGVFLSPTQSSGYTNTFALAAC